MNNDILKMLKATQKTAFETLSAIGDAKVANDIALSLLNQLISNLDLDLSDARDEGISNFMHHHSQMGDIASAIRDYIQQTNDLLENIA